MKHLLYLILSVAAMMPSTAADYRTIATKAQRFYGQKEWASATAMYWLMLEEKPDNPDTYSHAIISAAMQSDTTAQLALMEKAMQHHVPFDSIFTAVERESFSVGQGKLYENFMKHIKEAQPWLSRNIDGYLLRYYTFRKDADRMVEYSNIMLDGMPDDTGYLTTLAQGYMLGNKPHEAMSTYRRILFLEPDNYNALLELGNYNLILFRQTGNETYRKEALSMMRRAEALRPTPYITSVITGLEDTD